MNKCKILRKRINLIKEKIILKFGKNSIINTWEKEIEKGFKNIKKLS